MIVDIKILLLKPFIQSFAPLILEFNI
uniref:Uncharacterized protein n=1 Tax=Rhizophora mucronata TaxID=61149 RepID=A0A2P2P9K7_RHIMU